MSARAVPCCCMPEVCRRVLCRALSAEDCPPNTFRVLVEQRQALAYGTAQRGLPECYSQRWHQCEGCRHAQCRWHARECRAARKRGVVFTTADVMPAVRSNAAAVSESFVRKSEQDWYTRLACAVCGGCHATRAYAFTLPAWNSVGNARTATCRARQCRVAGRPEVAFRGGGGACSSVVRCARYKRQVWYLR